MELTENEKELIKMFRKLNDTNKNELIMILQLKYKIEIAGLTKGFKIAK